MLIVFVFSWFRMLLEYRRAMAQDRDAMVSPYSYTCLCTPLPFHADMALSLLLSFAIQSMGGKMIP